MQPITHNTGKTLRLKRQLKMYHYFSVMIDNATFCFHIAVFYLYSITSNLPKNTESV